MALAATVAMTACAGEAVPPPSALIKSQELSRAYRLGIGDKVKVNVYGEQDLSGQFEVSSAGAIALPLVGELPAKGRTIQEFRDQVAARLAQGYLTNPRVTVEVLSYRPIYVHGEVRNGGEFPFKSGMALRDAIALAGGYTYRANQSYVVLIREGDPQEHRVPLPSTLNVLPGDNIQIPERFF
jgi:polysaccharide export outer membrane protein